MIDKIDKTQISELMADIASRQARPVEKSDKNNIDASVQIDYAALIKDAAEIQESNPANIERVRQLISSGTLETSENYRQAAENLLVFGI
jgi:hypothetical protein